MLKHILSILILCTLTPTLHAGWATSLSFDGGGVWSKRVPVTFRNPTAAALEGKPCFVVLDRLQNFSAREIRVTNQAGQEMIFAASSGNTPLLAIPVECPAGGEATYYVYFNNPQAELVPEMLVARLGLTNGGMEGGNGRMPDGWDASDDAPGYRNFWSTENARTGKRCLQTVIDPGMAPDWFSVRQSNVPVIPGVKYRLTGWVRGENVVGRAGWFIHVGNDKSPQMLNQTRGDFDGTFDWREIVFEFTAPENADRLTIGTVLYGTGTAWFDDVTFVPVDPDAVRKHTVAVEIGEPESIPLTVIPCETAWPAVKTGDYLCRSTFRIINDSDAALSDVPVMMTLRGSLAHGIRGALDGLYVLDGDRKIPARLLDADNDRVIARLSVPPRAIKYFNVYYRFDESRAPQGFQAPTATNRDMQAETAMPESQVAADAFQGLPNLVQNGDFEAAPDTDGYPPHWRRNEQTPPPGVRYSLEADPKIVPFGRRCAKLEIAPDAPQQWRGWTQRVAVEPRKSYLVQGWLKTEGTTARIHIHFHTADGALCREGAMSSVGPDVSGDWTRLAEVLTAPADARYMTVHLTTNGPGTLWHDNISVFDGLFAEQLGRESFYDLRNAAFWQVPAIVKVFPQTIPVNAKKGFTLEAARNEKEPLQIALRSPQTQTVQVRVTPPKHATGFALDAYEINPVGYVSVNYPSNYYNAKTPQYYRKTPTAAPGCDGWRGLWPDPLLPGDRVALKPGQTESLWITWSIPKNAPAGKYTGQIEFLSPDLPPATRDVEITVRDFTLPDETHITAMYDVRFGPGAKLWGTPLREYYREIAAFMDDNRLSPDTVGVEPKVEFRDGAFHFDWTEFDAHCRWVFDVRKIRRAYMPHSLYLFGWAHPPKTFFGEEPYEGQWPYADADRATLRPEYRRRYQAYLREFWNHLKEKGWADRFVLYISDEPHYYDKPIIPQMQALCAMIHEVDPAIPIYCSTWSHIPEWDKSLDVWGIGHYGIVPVETMREIRESGSKIWFTTDGMMCLDTPYSAIERLLPYYCFRYDADAYEFWGVGWLTRDPYRHGDHAYIHQTSTPGEFYWVLYPNGDGYLLYPPKPIGAEKIVASVRFAQAREGVEDFEYLYLLREKITAAKLAGKDVTQAEAALAAAETLAPCPSPIGRYSSKILPNPERVYEVRRMVAEAIEELENKNK